MKMEMYKHKVINFLTKKGEVNKAEPPLEVKEVFSMYAKGGSHMSKDQILQFMVEHQGEKNCTLTDLEPIVEKVLQVGSSKTKTISIAGLSLNDFINFLLLDDFNGPLKDEVHHDMSAPLSHYFMYTGHNSYLTGNQFTSECSDEPIIEALQQGVRVIELDLWPSSSKDGIKVVHGRTLTTPVSLTKCLESIKEYAFVKSDFPVILTLEDHLTSKLQAKFAEMATQIFGEMLYYPETDCLTEFPSPESLKNRVVISTKPPKEYQESDSSSNHEPNGSDSSEEESWGQALSDSMAKLKNEERNESDEDEEDINTCDNKPNQLGSRRYKELITIYGGKSEGSMKDRLKIDSKVRRLSLSEKKLKSASESHGADLIRFTQKNILRVYPKGERVQSSNFRPHLGWMYGAQMVAFNMQGHGKSLRFMQGMFRANGGCGYVKKPEFMMQNLPHEEQFDPKGTLSVKQILKIKVYKGDGWKSDFSATHFDLFSPPDFYTKVCIVGVPADSVKKKTSVQMDNWFPVWDEEFEFPLTVPELALLRIEVKDKDKGKDDFAGQTCLPVSELRHGFRSVPLHDTKGKKFKSVKLLVRFQLETLDEF
ncbi:phosphoinositide phospholipase C 6-like [Gastrolobium bilobum]|uniref:phosphoinositide phospholipase C 6-like n=1 Tax=Gastrolobium bilobum TaxID=150636 RepID=UPI002AB1AC1C|nr:phosphoinositide phospholipase C 6-like [Gastrolobium bilobum]